MGQTNCASKPFLRDRLVFFLLEVLRDDCPRLPAIARYSVTWNFHLLKMTFFFVFKRNTLVGFKRNLALLDFFFPGGLNQMEGNQREGRIHEAMRASFPELRASCPKICLVVWSVQSFGETKSVFTEVRFA